MELLIELDLAPGLGLMKKSAEAQESAKESMLRNLSSVETTTIEER